VSEIDEHSFVVGEITRGLIEDYDKLVRTNTTTAVSAA